MYNCEKYWVKKDMNIDKIGGKIQALRSIIVLQLYGIEGGKRTWTCRTEEDNAYLLSMVYMYIINRYLNSTPKL